MPEKTPAAQRSPSPQPQQASAATQETPVAQTTSAAAPERAAAQAFFESPAKKPAKEPRADARTTPAQTATPASQPDPATPQIIDPNTREPLAVEKLGDEQFMLEELPDNFWDNDDIPPPSAPAKPAPKQSSAPTPSNKANPAPQTNAPQTTQPPATPDATTNAAGLESVPLFAELQSLFPGRVVSVETHEVEALEDDLAVDDPGVDRDDGLFDEDD